MRPLDDSQVKLTGTATTVGHGASLDGEAIRLHPGSALSLPRIADGAAYGVVSRLEEDLDWPTIHQAGHDPIPPVVGVDGGGSMVTLRFADHLGTGLIENISSVNGPLIAGVLVVPRWALCRPGTWHCALAI